MNYTSHVHPTVLSADRTGTTPERTKYSLRRATCIICAALLLNLFLIFSAHAGSETVNLSVAASMTNAFNDIIAAFSAAHPGVKLQPNYASSGALAKQIDQGAPADIYVSANPKWMKYLVEKELIAAGTDRVFAYNSLVFVGMEGGATSLDALTSLKRIAIGTPASVPAGQYAKQALDERGIYATLKMENKLIMAKDVRQALLYADRGEVDGAFVYKTDALLATQAKILFSVPTELYSRVAYPLGLTVEGSGKESARAFYDYLSGSEATGIFEKYGFEAAAE